MKYWLYFEPRASTKIESYSTIELGLIDIYDDEQNLIEEGSFIYKGVAIRTYSKDVGSSYRSYSDGHYYYLIIKDPPKDYDLETFGDWHNMKEFKTKKEAVNWMKKIPKISYKEYIKVNPFYARAKPDIYSEDDEEIRDYDLNRASNFEREHFKKTGKTTRETMKGFAESMQESDDNYKKAGETVNRWIGIIVLIILFLIALFYLL